jgi:hypothetical protein
MAVRRSLPTRQAVNKPGLLAQLDNGNQGLALLKGCARFAGIKTVCHGANAFVSVAVASVVRGNATSFAARPISSKDNKAARRRDQDFIISDQ